MVVRTSSVPAVIKRLTGANLDATRNFLFREGFVPRKGFWSQYADQGKKARNACAATETD
jgi:hypothetical protein